MTNERIKQFPRDAKEERKSIEKKHKRERKSTEIIQILQHIKEQRQKGSDDIVTRGRPGLDWVRRSYEKKFEVGSGRSTKN